MRRSTAAGALVLLALLAAACSDGGGSATDAAAGAAAAGQATTTTAPVAEAPFAVGRQDFTFVDTSRPTDAVPDRGVEARPDRTIPVIVTYPAVGDPGEPPTLREVWDEDGDPEGRSAVLGAEPVDGPFPLVVFAHGWMGNGASLLPLAERWARSGYVVALPTFPLSRAPIGFGGDVVNQPADVSFVLDELLGLPGDEPLAGVVDGDHVALGGHSLGSATVFRAVYSGCCTDDRIDATIAVAGGPQDAGADTYLDQPDVPMLLAHGSADFVPVEISDAMVDFITAPVTYLRLTDGDHTNVFVGARGELFSTAVLAFLDAELRGRPEGLAGLADVVAGSGLGELRTG
jgi:predicted dienelactone hydrolase